MRVAPSLTRRASFSMADTDCTFCETCGCCLIHSDCSPDYCACAPSIYGSGPVEESD
jgi:hypothetical protein